MKKQESNFFLYHRAGYGDVKQFVNITYPGTEYEHMSVTKAKELGLIGNDTEIPVIYKAFFIKEGRIEPDPCILLNVPSDFEKKFHKWYFSEERSKWFKEQAKKNEEEFEKYYDGD